jgi:D-hexose-6-phosphate mutarotase
MPHDDSLQRAKQQTTFSFPNQNHLRMSFLLHTCHEVVKTRYKITDSTSLQLPRTKLHQALHKAKPFIFCKLHEISALKIENQQTASCLHSTALQTYLESRDCTTITSCQLTDTYLKQTKGKVSNRTFMATRSLYLLATFNTSTRALNKMIKVH